MLTNVSRLNVMESDSPQKQMPAPRIFVERTLALIKPDAIHKTDEIEDVILQSGFTILKVCMLRHVASLFYIYISLCSTSELNYLRGELTLSLILVVL